MSPDDVLAKLVKIFPTFDPYWNSEENLFREEDGKFSLCGVFACFTGFFRQHYTELESNQLVTLGNTISQWMVLSPDLDNAVATCFLENISGEAKFADFKKNLSGGAVAFISQWQADN
jgi:hypothetical protein